MEQSPMRKKAGRMQEQFAYRRPGAISAAKRERMETLRKKGLDERVEAAFVTHEAKMAARALAHASDRFRLASRRAQTASDGARERSRTAIDTVRAIKERRAIQDNSARGWGLWAPPKRPKPEPEKPRPQSARTPTRGSSFASAAAFLKSERESQGAEKEEEKVPEEAERSVATPRRRFRPSLGGDGEYDDGDLGDEERLSQMPALKPIEIPESPLFSVLSSWADGPHGHLLRRKDEDGDTKRAGHDKVGFVPLPKVEESKSKEANFGLEGIEKVDDDYFEVGGEEEEEEEEEEKKKVVVEKEREKEIAKKSSGTKRRRRRTLQSPDKDKSMQALMGTTRRPLWSAGFMLDTALSIADREELRLRREGHGTSGEGSKRNRKAPRWAVQAYHAGLEAMKKMESRDAVEDDASAPVGSLRPVRAAYLAVGLRHEADEEAPSMDVMARNRRQTRYVPGETADRLESLFEDSSRPSVSHRETASENTSEDEVDKLVRLSEKREEDDDSTSFEEEEEEGEEEEEEVKEKEIRSVADLSRGLQQEEALARQKVLKGLAKLHGENHDLDDDSGDEEVNGAVAEDEVPSDGNRAGGSTRDTIASVLRIGTASRRESRVRTPGGQREDEVLRRVMVAGRDRDAKAALEWTMRWQRFLAKVPPNVRGPKISPPRASNSAAFGFVPASKRIHAILRREWHGDVPQSRFLRERSHDELGFRSLRPQSARARIESRAVVFSEGVSPRKPPSKYVIPSLQISKLGPTTSSLYSGTSSSPHPPPPPKSTPIRPSTARPIRTQFSPRARVVAARAKEMNAEFERTVARGRNREKKRVEDAVSAARERLLRRDLLAAKRRKQERQGRWAMVVTQALVCRRVGAAIARARQQRINMAAAIFVQRLLRGIHARRYKAKLMACRARIGAVVWMWRIAQAIRRKRRAAACLRSFLKESTLVGPSRAMRGQIHRLVARVRSAQRHWRDHRICNAARMRLLEQWWMREESNLLHSRPPPPTTSTSVAPRSSKSSSKKKATISRARSVARSISSSGGTKKKTKKRREASPSTTTIDSTELSPAEIALQRTRLAERLRSAVNAGTRTTVLHSYLYDRIRRHAEAVREEREDYVRRRLRGPRDPKTIRALRRAFRPSPLALLTGGGPTEIETLFRRALSIAVTQRGVYSRF